MSTKEKIIQASIELFATKGYDATSVKNICDLAGANICSVNYHFKNKENLFAIIIEESLNKYLQSNDKILNTEINSIEEFNVVQRMFCKSLIDIANENWKFLSVFFNNSNHIRSQTKIALEPMIKKLLKQYSDFITKHQNLNIISKEIDPELTAEIIYDSINWKLYIKYLVPNINPDIFDEEYQKTYIDSLSKMLF